LYPIPPPVSRLFAVVLDVLYQALSWESRWPFIPSRGFIPVCVYGFTVSCLASGEDETTLLGIPLKKSEPETGMPTLNGIFFE